MTTLTFLFLEADRKRSLTEDNEPPSKRRKTSTGEVSWHKSYAVGFVNINLT